jgi:hypothetical protein
MLASDVIRYRLLNQQIGETTFQKPREIVHWMAAMQAQEFAMAKWAIGLRLTGVTDSDVENAFDKGEILRTHLLRPTWHFVTRQDIRWMLELTAPRVHALNAYSYRKFELDNAILKRSRAVLTKMLEGGKFLTREALNAELERAKILAKGLRLGYLFMHAELEGLICSGPRDGKQFTYALLEERAPDSKKMSREESLAELTKRYFLSRGPATIKDFAYWSGLTIKEVKEGTSMLKKDFVHEKYDGQEYIFAYPASKSKKLQATFLMPDYDEYGMSYKDRSTLATQKKTTDKKLHPKAEYNHWMVVNGVIEGTWLPATKGKKASVETLAFTTHNKIEEAAMKHAIKRYTSFIGTSK